MRSACSRASSTVSTGPLLHGATGTPAFSAISLDWILSPSARITSPRRTDEDEAQLLDHVRERGMLGDEAPAGPDGVGPGRDQGLLEALVVQVRAGALAVGVDGRGRPEVVGLVGVADEHRAALGLGVERDDADRIVLALGVELADGVDETHRGFAAIDYGETAKRALGHRRHRWHVTAWRCISAGMEFLQPSKWREALEARAAHPDATADLGRNRRDGRAELRAQAPGGAARPRRASTSFRAGARRTGGSGSVRACRTRGSSPSSARRCRGSRWRRARSVRRRSATGGRSGGTSARRRPRATRCRRCSRAARTSSWRRVRGSRRVPVEEFVIGPKRNVLAEDELIAAVWMPAAGGPQQFAKVGHAQRDGDRGLLVRAGLSRRARGDVHRVGRRRRRSARARPRRSR